MSAPTPTPWRLANYSACAIYAETETTTKRIGATSETGDPMEPDTVTDEANAAHIVRCVNERDELIEALRNCVGWMVVLDDEGIGSGAIEAMRTVLARVEAA